MQLRWLPSSLVSAVFTTLLFTQLSTSQTWSNCNPIQSSGCPADSALGKSVSIDFTKGSSDSFTPQGSPTYGSDGAKFEVAKSGDSPQIVSRWYIMFGKVDVVVKAAPGAGIVSSFVLQSDTLDEIDWEWLGADADEVQSNYFGKGQTGSFNRGAFHADTGSQSGYHTYTIDWNADQIVWQIDGKTVRVQTAATAETNQYPQTPMQVKIGAWSGGDSANPQGTIQWAKGPTDYSKGPYSMYVKSISITDYSSGSQYKYGDNSGTWQSIQAVGGTVNSKGGGTAAGSSAPAITSKASGQPIPFAGTTLYPSATGGNSRYTTTLSNFPGLPSGWTVTTSGKVVPPNAAAKGCKYFLFLLPKALANLFYRRNLPCNPYCLTPTCRNHAHRPSSLMPSPCIRRQHLKTCTTSFSF
jgi:hypothetical protein